MSEQKSSIIKTTIVGLCAILILIIVVGFVFWRHKRVHRELRCQIKGKPVIFPPNKLYLAEAKGKGMGVFASDAISKGEIVEVCHLHYLKRNEKITGYMFGRNPKGVDLKKQRYVAFGFGSIYNHSDDYNIDYENNGKTMKFFATRNINVNEECCVDYGKKYWDFHGVEKKI